MNEILLHKAERALLYNIYLYLADKVSPADGDTLATIVSQLTASDHLDPIEQRQLRVLLGAISCDPILSAARIGNQVTSENGMTACTFTESDNTVCVAFRGTGSGEWIDNGEGLSGIPQENTYITYRNGKEQRTTVSNDYATNRQVEALNWFHRIADRNGWTADTDITVSGHSKGGNKAQFVAMKSPLADRAFSFDGQGFSPEAITAFRQQLGTEFERRRSHIFSISADNDYVNVLGERVMKPENILFFEAPIGDALAPAYHLPEAMLDRLGRFHPPSEPGYIARYFEAASEQLMRMKPAVRRYATIGVMNIFQNLIGKGTAVNGDRVSPEETFAGIGIAAGILIDRLRPPTDMPVTSGWDRLA